MGWSVIQQPEPGFLIHNSKPIKIAEGIPPQRGVLAYGYCNLKTGNYRPGNRPFNISAYDDHPDHQDRSEKDTNNGYSL